MFKRILILFIVGFLFSFASGCFANNSSDEILGYMNLTKSELLKKLGSQFEIIQTGPEATYEAYYYKKIGIAVSFDDDQKVAFIDCDKGVKIKGAAAGMNFEQIQKALGKSKIYEISDEESNSVIYEVRYIIGNCNLIFMSDKKDGRDSSLSIHRIGATYNYPDPAKK